MNKHLNAKWVYVVMGIILISYVSSCSPKYGCPSDGKNVGAEKLLNGGKAPKAKKFKA